MAADLTGKVFGEWTVLARSRMGVNRTQLWLCQCSCSTQREVSEYDLTSGRSKRCTRCRCADNGKVSRSHGMRQSIVYRRWIAIKAVCYNPKTGGWKYHGGLGIGMAPEWRRDFMTFYEHVGDPPTQYHTIVLIDRLGDYAPGNVRWATQNERIIETRRIAAGIKSGTVV